MVDGDKLRTILKTWSKCSMMPSPIPVTAMSPLTSSLSNFLSQMAGYAVTSLFLGHRLLQDGCRVPILQTLETSCNALHELKRMLMGTYTWISACRPRDTNYEKRQQDRMVWGEKKLSENKSAFSGPTSQPAQGWEAETSSRPKLRAVKIKNPIHHLHFVNSYTPFWASQVAQW